MNSEQTESPLDILTLEELAAYLASLDVKYIPPDKVNEIRQAASRLGVDVECPNRPTITASEYWRSRVLDDKKAANEWDNFALNFIARIREAVKFHSKVTGAEKQRMIDLWESGKTWPEVARIVLNEFHDLDFDSSDKDEQKRHIDSITSQAKYHAKQNGITLRKGDRGRPTLQK